MYDYIQFIDDDSRNHTGFQKWKDTSSLKLGKYCGILATEKGFIPANGTIHGTNIKVIVTVGMPASGKSTLAKYLEEKYGAVSVGWDKAKRTSSIPFDSQNPQAYYEMLRQCVIDDIKKAVSGGASTIIFDSCGDTRMKDIEKLFHGIPAVFEIFSFRNSINSFATCLLRAFARTDKEKESTTLISNNPDFCSKTLSVMWTKFMKLAIKFGKIVPKTKFEKLLFAICQKGCGKQGTTKGFRVTSEIVQNAMDELGKQACFREMYDELNTEASNSKKMIIRLLIEKVASNDAPYEPIEKMGDDLMKKIVNATDVATSIPQPPTYSYLALPFSDSESLLTKAKVDFSKMNQPLTPHVTLVPPTSMKKPEAMQELAGKLSVTISVTGVIVTLRQIVAIVAISDYPELEQYDGNPRELLHITLATSHGVPAFESKAVMKKFRDGEIDDTQIIPLPEPKEYDVTAIIL